MGKLPYLARKTTVTEGARFFERISIDRYGLQLCCSAKSGSKRRTARFARFG